jgi:hypothetical protein
MEIGGLCKVEPGAGRDCERGLGLYVVELVFSDKAEEHGSRAANGSRSVQGKTGEISQKGEVN